MQPPVQADIYELKDWKLPELCRVQDRLKAACKSTQDVQHYINRDYAASTAQQLDTSGTGCAAAAVPSLSGHWPHQLSSCHPARQPNSCEQPPSWKQKFLCKVFVSMLESSLKKFTRRTDIGEYRTGPISPVVHRNLRR